MKMKKNKFNRDYDLSSANKKGSDSKLGTSKVACSIIHLIMRFFPRVYRVMELLETAELHPSCRWVRT